MEQEMIISLQFSFSATPCSAVKRSRFFIKNTTCGDGWIRSLLGIP